MLLGNTEKKMWLQDPKALCSWEEVAVNADDDCIS